MTMNFNQYLNNKTSNDPELSNKIASYKWLKEIGMRVAELRQYKGYKQSDLAAKMNVSQSVIARIESGSNMTCLTLWKLGDVLNVDLELFGASANTEKNKVQNYLLNNATIEKPIVANTGSFNVFIITSGSISLDQSSSPIISNYSFSNGQEQQYATDGK